MWLLFGSKTCPGRRRVPGFLSFPMAIRRVLLLPVVVFVRCRVSLAQWSTFLVVAKLLHNLAVVRTIFDFYLGSPPPPVGVPGEGPDVRFPAEFGCLGAVPARIWGR
jgi:hypothetical protein